MLDRKWFLALLVLLAVMLLIVLAACTDVRDGENNEPTTSSPTTLVDSPPPVERMYGPNAAWNRPISDFDVAPNEDDLARRFWASHVNPELVRWRGPSIVTDQIAEPIYTATADTPRRRVWHELAISNRQGIGNVGNGGLVPWDDSWRGGGGEDSLAVILDPATGQEWDMFRVNVAVGDCLYAVILGAKAGDLCVGRADVVTNPDGVPIDYRTYEGGFPPSSGAGLPLAVGTVTAAEVASGTIPHALAVDVWGSMFGPSCPGNDPNALGAGVTCGYYTPPATKLEWSQGPNNACGQPPRADQMVDTIPEGTRYWLDVTNDDIDAFVNTVPESQQFAAGVFAEALRDYGWLIVDTSCAGSGIDTTGLRGPDEALWRELGIDANSDRLLDGLFTAERIRAVSP